MPKGTRSKPSLEKFFYQVGEVDRDVSGYWSIGRILGLFPDHTLNSYPLGTRSSFKTELKSDVLLTDSNSHQN